MHEEGTALPTEFAAELFCFKTVAKFGHSGCGTEEMRLGSEDRTGRRRFSVKFPRVGAGAQSASISNRNHCLSQVVSIGKCIALKFRASTNCPPPPARHGKPIPDLVLRIPSTGKLTNIGFPSLLAHFSYTKGRFWLMPGPPPSLLTLE